MLRFEVINLSQALSGTSAEVLFGIPASAEATVSHNPSVENIGNGLQGLIDGLNDLETVPGVIRGLSIYPAWEMDAAKWSIYESEWQRVIPK